MKNQCCEPKHIIIDGFLYILDPKYGIALPIQSKDLVYVGPVLPGTGIRDGDTMSVALQKIDDKIWKLTQAVYNLTTTTTTIIP